jgi:hypothetical protein
LIIKSLKNKRRAEIAKLDATEPSNINPRNKKCKLSQRRRESRNEKPRV